MASKSLARNSFYNVIYKSLNVVFPLFTTMYISRILLPSGVGRVAVAQNVATYFTLIVALGLPTYGVKVIAGTADNQEKLNKYFSELFVINFLSSLSCSTAYYSLLFTMEVFRQNLKLYMIMGLPIILNIFNIDWFYQGIEEYKYIMKRSILVKVGCFAAMIVLVREVEDYLIYALILNLGTVLNYVFNVVHLRNKVKFILRGLNLRKHIKPVFVLLASSLAIEIYSLMGVTVLSSFCGEEVVAYYSNSLKGIKIIKNFIVSICTVFLPRLSYYYENGRVEEFKKLAVGGIKILLYFAVPTCFGCILISESLVSVLFGEKFMPAATTINILATTIVTIAISNFVGYQVLVVTGHERKMLYATCLGAVMNIILNLVLIPVLQHNGAAVATLITETVVAGIQYMMMVKYLSIKVDMKYWGNVVLGSVLMCVAAGFCCQFGNSAIVKCLVAGIVGVGSYVCLTVFLKNEMATVVVSKAKAILKRSS